MKKKLEIASFANNANKAYTGKYNTKNLIKKILFNEIRMDELSDEQLKDCIETLHSDFIMFSLLIMLNFGILLLFLY